MTDQPKKDYFAEKLAKMSAENTVLASTNIVNEQGVLVVGEGTELTSDVARQISKHKLKRSLDLQISLSNVITGQSILNHLKHNREHPEIRSLMERSIALDLVERECSKLANYPLLLQKLTVLKSQLPQTFDSAVIGAYIALLIAKEMQSSASDLHVVFLAALARDVGYLHLPAEISTSELSPLSGQWILFQSHPVVSSGFLDVVPGMPPMASRAVLEHHEQTDGMGFPRQLMADELSLQGQIVAYSDLVIRWFDRHIANHNFRLKALKYVALVSFGQHTRRINLAAMRILREMFLEDTHRVSGADAQKWLPTLLQNQVYVRNWFELAQGNFDVLRPHVPDAIILRIGRFLSHAQHVLATSGIVDSLHLDWLRQLKMSELTEDDLKELEQFSVMIRETVFQFRYAYLVIVDLLQKHRHEITSEHLPELDRRMALMRDLLTRFEKDFV